MVQITLCANNIVEQLHLSPEETLGDLKSTVYNITGIEPTAQLLDGIRSSSDSVIRLMIKFKITFTQIITYRN